jgi:hypothetical protein
MAFQPTNRLLALLGIATVCDCATPVDSWQTAAEHPSAPPLSFYTCVDAASAHLSVQADAALRALGDCITTCEIHDIRPLLSPKWSEVFASNPPTSLVPLLQLFARRPATLNNDIVRLVRSGVPMERLDAIWMGTEPKGDPLRRGMIVVGRAQVGAPDSGEASDAQVRLRAEDYSGALASRVVPGSKAEEAPIVRTHGGQNAPTNQRTWMSPYFRKKIPPPPGDPPGRPGIERRGRVSTGPSSLVTVHRAGEVYDILLTTSRPTTLRPGDDVVFLMRFSEGRAVVPGSNSNQRVHELEGTLLRFLRVPRASQVDSAR